MKIAMCLFGGLMLAAGGVSSASTMLTVKVQTRVQDVYDPGGALQNQVAIGQSVAGSYSYDTTVWDQEPSPRYGTYLQSEGGLSFTVGSQTIEAKPQFGNYEIDVHPSDWPGYYQGSFRLKGSTNTQFPNGANVRSISIDFSDMHSGAPFSEALPTGAPDLNQYQDRSVMIDGDLNGTWFSILLRIESVQIQYDGSPLVISPGESTFVRDQRFDVALMLPPGTGPVQQISARVGSQYLPLNYPGNCMLAPPNSQERPAILCRDVQWALLPQSGPQHVEWEVRLSNGETLLNAVDWELIR